MSVRYSHFIFPLRSTSTARVSLILLIRVWPSGRRTAFTGSVASTFHTGFPCRLYSTTRLLFISGISTLPLGNISSRPPEVDSSTLNPRVSLPFRSTIWNRAPPAAR